MKAKDYGLLLLIFLLSNGVTPNTTPEISTLVKTAGQISDGIFIKLLQNGESYSIEITAMGCFNGSRQSIIVSKDANVITASFKGVSKILSKKDLEVFRNFENGLLSLQVGGCSAIDIYVLKYRGETFQTSDGTCNWFGYRKLLELFD